jgi:two-component system invasion response regulator UvrY|tara:strand:- start:149 stop:463 length:315 start_codon:yes stop_codon:yes gene_type:complete
MFRAGAMDFITKSVGVDEMLKAIRMVSAGDYSVTPEVATGLRLILLTILGNKLCDKLSLHEMHIVQMLTEGKKVSQISELLELSPKSVYSYRYRILKSSVLAAM